MRLSDQLPRRRVIGLTALIDVVFLLLVFFMLASTFLKFGSLKIDTGAAGTAAVALGKIVLVNVGKDRRLTLDGQEIAAGSLAERLAELKRGGREKVVIAVRPDADVSDMLGILGIARQGGFKSVQVVR